MCQIFLRKINWDVCSVAQQVVCGLISGEFELNRQHCAGVWGTAHLCRQELWGGRDGGGVAQSWQLQLCLRRPWKRVYHSLFWSHFPISLLSLPVCQWCTAVKDAALQENIKLFVSSEREWPLFHKESNKFVAKSLKFMHKNCKKAKINWAVMRQ